VGVCVCGGGGDEGVSVCPVFINVVQLTITTFKCYTKHKLLEFTCNVNHNEYMKLNDQTILKG
jgi:hypothetical protein